MADRYELIERIAVGGMAEIFRANKIGAAGFVKPVAVKRILPQLASDPEFVDRFVAEAKIAVTLAHPNIVSVFELSRFAESLYICMEFVDGPDLASLIKSARNSGSTVELGPAVHIAGELLRGLEHAHENGVIHRDVSPSNVLVSRSGEVKIADFGIAKIGGADVTNNRRVMGKWPYMSPEQADGLPVDSRSDLFSAGAVLFELFCGRRLFRGETTNDIIEAIRSQPIDPPSLLRPEIPEALDRAIMALVERDPERRAAAAAEVLADLVDVPFEISSRATAPALAAEVERVCPPRPRAGETGAQLIDHIINSELEHARGGRRLTVKTERVRGGRETDALSFVSTDSGGDGGDIGQWLLGDAENTYTLKQTLQLFALVDDDDSRAAADGAADRATTPLSSFGRDPRSRVTEPATPQRMPTLESSPARAPVPEPIVPPASGPARPAPPTSSPPAPIAPAADPIAAPSLQPPAPSRLPIALTAAAIAVIAAIAALIATRDRAPGATSAPPAPHDAARLERPMADAAPPPATTAALTVTTRPPGATVSLAGEVLGTTPVEALAVEPRDAATDLVIARDGFEPVRLKVELIAGARIRVARDLAPTGEPGLVEIRSTPRADVYWRGKRIGRTPMRNVELPAGTHTLRLVDRRRALRAEVEVVVPGDPVIDVRLER